MNTVARLQLGNCVGRNDEAGTEQRAADERGRDVGRLDVQRPEVHQSGGRQREQARHRRHDGREHHLEHRHVVQVELRRQLARTAESGPLEEEAEAEPEHERDEQGELLAEEAVLVEGSHDYRHCQRMNQATA